MREWAVEVLEAAGAAVEHRAALLRLILIWMGNAQNLGYGVKTYNKKQYEKKQEAYRADRKATSNFLNTMDAQMGGNKRAQRKATASRRGSRRK